MVLKATHVNENVRSAHRDREIKVSQLDSTRKASAPYMPPHKKRSQGIPTPYIEPSPATTEPLKYSPVTNNVMTGQRMNSADGITCWYWQNYGYCKRGDACKYAHDSTCISSGPPPSNSNVGEEMRRKFGQTLQYQQAAYQPQQAPRYTSRVEMHRKISVAAAQRPLM